MFMRHFALVILLFPLAASAEKRMPCESVTEELKEGLSYFSEEQTPAFLSCVAKNRVCAVADGQTISAASIESLQSAAEATTFVVVQSPSSEREPVCLIGQYSGGSAAAWLFKAFKLIGRKAVAFRGMEKAYAQGDAIPPQSAALMTYKIFEKYAQNSP